MSSGRSVEAAGRAADAEAGSADAAGADPVGGEARGSTASEAETTDDGEAAETTDGAGRPSDDADGGEAETGDGAGVCANELLELLGNRRRRLLWRHLRTAESAAALSDASRRIAAWENDVDPADVEYDQRKSVYTSLRQFHCPKMAEAGLVEFDDRDGTVRLASDLPEELVVEIEPDTANVRRTAVGALALAAGLILGAWAAGLPVFGSLSFAGVALAVAAAVVAGGVVYGAAVRSEHGVSLGDALARVDG
jgi:hypothetical protein